ncbi:MAG: tetratricopeptide repeat protein [Bacteroidales bacterium]|nr:tetratricopeptide repeat protein [Bacteroidales bacterium]
MNAVDWLKTAKSAFARGDHAGAIHALEAVRALDPDCREALHVLGTLYATTGRLTDAEPLLLRAVTLFPQDVNSWVNLGEVQRRRGQLAEAAISLRRAVTLAPAFAEAWFNLGNTLKSLNDWPGAEEALRRAVTLQPQHARAWYNLGNLLREDGRTPGAETAYRRALALQPHWPEPWQNLAATYADLSRPTDAADCWRKVRELVPDHPDADTGEAAAWVQAGRPEDAVPLFQRVAERHPTSFTAQLKPTLLPDPIPASVSAITAYRAELWDTVHALQNRGLSLDLAELHRSGCEPPTLLLYQGQNDRPLMEAFAALFRRHLPEVEPPRVGTGIPHVGVVVTRGHEGVFDRCLGLLLDEAVCPELRISLIGQRGAVSVLKHLRPQRKCEYLIVPDDLPSADLTIRAAGCDLLHYWEIGTDSFNYFLPYFRSAPIQTNTWGWPVTSGNPAVDAYISCDWLEPIGAEALYSEPLIRLRHLPARYERPPAPLDRVDPAEFGMASDQRLYLCPQNLRKLHPDLDAAVAQLLDTDTGAVFGVIADERPAVTAAFVQRLRRTTGETRQLRVFPRQDRCEYLRLVAAASVLVDPPHYGAGANTLADAFACAVPLMAWEGSHHRSRWVSGAYQALGVVDRVNLTATTAEEWVKRAIQAAHPDARQKHGLAMQSAGEQFFAPSPAAQELRAFFLEQIAQSRHSLSFDGRQ